ncbi:MAG: excinuclease ABC subunit UvrB [Desulfobacterales bacterium]|mgnify:CR=1 FL=1|jgi:excinuclease ABC subunit B|nr:excinuclease ABC subunit UvrB [Desulfobacteraceae bacterium]MBT4365347.1 excinuclease ABC subunit UvrB [Desulfobacteraceae bacterium]MBT7084745.1 excinuclease ABC subunit UvrB [Desulfobacterales bacterium]MBT7696059.1 excinuclease ABC subunit UvrB [Desulfobacterales bacterium]
MSEFKIISEFVPKGDQPGAIDTLSEGILNDRKHQVLLGVTGSGKTFTMANVIQRVQKPTLVIAPNKTLAAQLYNEFKVLFPENAVEYFVSYYDYYQPEAYIPTSDTYIQKDSSINEMIDKLRHSATRSVLTRKDVIIVASVSCIFGLGAPEDYLAMRVDIVKGKEMSRDAMLSGFVAMHYERNDVDFYRGVFRVRGDRVEIFPAYEEAMAYRIEFFGDEIESLAEIDPLKGNVIRSLNHLTIYPASHYVTQKQTRTRAIETIKDELKERIAFFRNENKLIEAQRIEERTNFDLEMMLEIGYCNGIENYSRHITGREPGEPPPTLIDYYPEDFLIFIDESHIAMPQIRAMYKGDRSRKETLIKYGFRLPSALDNRPFKFEEFVSRISRIIFVSATPADYELDMSRQNVVEQIVRPTGLIDPVIDVRSAKNQVDDLFEEVQDRIKKDERVLVTTLTKRMAEDLTDYYSDLGVKVRYLHSDVKTMERIEIIQDLRMGKFHVLIGINLLREGLDIPEVSLVAILDADKEGFLRSARSLIQICGRASRNVNGKVIMYADRNTDSMKQAMNETNRRRKVQESYNSYFNITPKSIEKDITKVFDFEETTNSNIQDKVVETIAEYKTLDNLDEIINSLEKEMNETAKALDFERAAEIRDIIRELKKIVVFEL